MSNLDPSPESSGVAADETVRSEIATVISGQKRLLYSILSYFFAAPLLISATAFLDETDGKLVPTPPFLALVALAFLVVLASVFGASTGIFRMGRVLYPGLSRYLYAIGVWIPVPLIGLLVMFAANSSATGFLRAHGIKVGFMGAKR